MKEHWLNHPGVTFSMLSVDGFVDGEFETEHDVQEMRDSLAKSGVNGLIERQFTRPGETGGVVVFALPNQAEDIFHQYKKGWEEW